MQGIKVVSLFDGISCGRIALDRAGVGVESYEAYEIAPSAIEISKRNYPDIVHHGDVTTADFSIHKDIDLLIGGSPCKGLSSANVYLEKGELGGLETGESSLFWYFDLALRTIKPRYFLFENVASMKQTDRDIITTELGANPIRIDSVLFSGQTRRRLYWTNIPFLTPTDRVVNTKLVDILETGVHDKYYLKDGTAKYIMSNGKNGWRGGKNIINPEFARTITASCWKMHKADTDTYVSTEYAPVGRTNIRKLTPVECERLQTLPDNYTLNPSSPNLDRPRYEAIGNGWTVDVIAHIFKGMKND